MEKTNNTGKTKKTRRLFVCAIIFFTVGTLLFCGGMFALGWDFSRLDTNTYTARVYSGESGSTVTSLEIKASGRDITVSGIKEGALSVEWFDSDSDKVEVTLSDGKLTVKEKFTFVFGQIFNWTSGEKNKLIIKIPVDSLNSLDVNHSGGSFGINGIETINKIKYRQSGGSADISGVLQTDTISYSGSGGSFKLNGAKASSIDFHQSGGSAYFNNVKTGILNFDTSGGRLTVSELKVDQFDIKLSGGKVSGSVAAKETDYAVTISKSGGSCNIKEKSGIVAGKWIHVKQSGGTVALSFDDTNP